MNMAHIYIILLIGPFIRNPFNPSNNFLVTYIVRFIIPEPFHRVIFSAVCSTWNINRILVRILVFRIVSLTYWCTLNDGEP